MPRLLPVLMIAALLFFPAQGSGDDEKPIPCHSCCEKKLKQCNKNCSSYNILCKDGCKTVFEGCLESCIAQGQPAVKCS